MDGDKSYEPGTTVCCSHGSPTSSATTADANTYAGLLEEWSTGTYGNGVIPMTANYGDSNIGETDPLQCEIPPVFPATTSNTPYDKETVIPIGKSITVVHHVVNKVYWLKGSKLTTTKNVTRLIPAGDGLVKVALAHTATAKVMHQWMAKQTVSSATWVKGKYMGQIPSYTA